MDLKFDTAKVIADYQSREPGQADTWNPLSSQFELSYRFSLLYALIKVLGLAEVSIEKLTVLDLGCGNGRSTRAYLDLGFKPEQLTGLDIRIGAIELAQKIHPAINFRLYDGQEIPFPPQYFNWVQVATVFSSVLEQNSRQYLVKEIAEKLPIGGYVFYYDLYRANQFAGGDKISPVELFCGAGKFAEISQQFLRSYQFIPGNNRFKYFDLKGLISGLVTGNLKGNIKNFYPALRYRIRRFIEPTHQAVLFKKIAA
jgi:SAM-dependent methyltransferase